MVLLLIGLLPLWLSLPVQGVDVKNEKLRVPDEKVPQVRLQYGLLMVPGSEVIRTRDGKVRFRRVEGDPQKGEYRITPTGLITFHPKDRGRKLYADYQYRPRKLLLLPVDPGPADKKVASEVYKQVEYLFRLKGYEVIPESQYRNLLEQQRFYPSGELSPELGRLLAREYGADDLAIVQVEEWRTQSGKSFIGFLWNPFGGRKKQVLLGLKARLYDPQSGRLIWESETATVEKGGRLGGVPEEMKKSAISRAVYRLFSSFFNP